MIKRLRNPDRWVSIPVAALEDERLSWKARGLLAFILAKPDDWEVRRDNLIASSQHDGMTSVKSALKELVEHGYAELIPVRNAENTGLKGWRYDVSDSSPIQQETLRSENQAVRKRDGMKTAPITYRPEDRPIDQKKNLLPTRAREDFQSREESAEEAEARLGDQSLCDYPDPNGWACPHETAALIGLAEILDRPVKKTHRNLHAFVHSHSLAETLDVARHFTEHEQDRSKWTLGLMYAPDNAEARLAAAHAPNHAPKPPQRPEDRPDRPQAYREFDREEPLPTGERVPAREVKELLSGLYETFNERGE